MHSLVMTQKTVDQYRHNSWSDQVVNWRISIAG